MWSGMTDLEVWKLLGQGGFAVALLFMIYKLGLRGVAAIDRVGVKMDGFGGQVNEHTKADLAAQAEVRREVTAAGNAIMGAIGNLREDVAVLDARQEQMRLDWADQMTPVTAERYREAREAREERSPTYMRTMQTGRTAQIDPDLDAPRPASRPTTGEYSVRRPGDSERDVRNPRRR
jgi:hypothetical protein